MQVALDALALPHILYIDPIFAVVVHILFILTKNVSLSLPSAWNLGVIFDGNLIVYDVSLCCRQYINVRL